MHRYEDSWGLLNAHIDLLTIFQKMNLCRFYVHDTSGHSGPSLVTDDMDHFSEQMWEKYWYWQNKEVKGCDVLE